MTRDSMDITRRQFHGLALAALAVAMARPAAASTSGSDARKTLNRLTFGANDAAIAEFERLGKSAWLEAELAKPVVDDALAARLSAATLRIEYEAGNDGPGKSWPARAEDLPYQYFDASGESLLPLLDYSKGMNYDERIRPAREVQAAALMRAVHADAQLREVLAQFWHNHFNVNAMKDEHCAAYFAAYDKVMRANALGNFRVLLGEVARSPAMLFYLNNEASKASPANENYGRELLELHTLGAENYLNDLYDDWKAVPGAKDGLALGYIDADVYEVARAFTGWSFGDGRWLADGDEAPRSGEFAYVDSWHDPYQKRVLAVEFGPNRAPMADGESVLDLLAHHPGVARFISRKLIRRLLTDEPSETLVDGVAKVFLAAADDDDQIAQVVRAIAMSDEFDATPARKLKRPFEFLASLYRASGLEVTKPSIGYVWELQQSGWSQHEFRPPSGHSDKSEHWANTSTLNGLVNIALYAHEDWYGTGTIDFVTLHEGVETWDEMFAYWQRKMGGADAEASAAEFLALTGIDPAEAVSGNPDDRRWAMASAAGIAALQPSFLFR